MMNQFAEIMGGHGDAPVAHPYFVIDVDPAENGGQDSKLLLTEWSDADEHFSNRFIDGDVDPRVIKGLAIALVKLNLSPVAAEWKEDCRACFQSFHPVFKQIFKRIL
jgi:hypothetical protein